MSTFSASLATTETGFTPLVVPLDVTSDGLSAFASEHDAKPAPMVPRLAAIPARPAFPAPAATAASAAAITPILVTAKPVAVPPRTAQGLRLRVPGWMGAGSLAILTGGLTGLMIASFFQAQVVALPTAGAVTITSEPPAMPVRVDGMLRGSTPFATMLTAGAHRVEVGSGTEARVRQLQVRPGSEALVHVAWPVAPTPVTERPATAAERGLAASTDVALRPAPARLASAAAPAAPPPPTIIEVVPATPRPRPAPVVKPPTGSLAVTSPFPVRVIVDGEEIGTSATARLTVPAGAHTVTLVNDRLEFEYSEAVTIAAHRTRALGVVPPQGTLHVNAQPWAQVLVDGRRAGETPIGNLSLAVGEHEIVLRHPELGEQRRTVTVGARTPVRVGVEFTR